MPVTMLKAITICQPWAELILAGHKQVENRTWATPHTGDLVIHAGKKTHWFQDIPEAVVPFMPSRVAGRYELGALVGIVEVVGCMSIDELREHRPDSDQVRIWACGPVCWLLRNPRRIKPVPWRGRPGIFNVPSHKVQGVRRAGSDSPQERGRGHRRSA